VRFRCCDAAGAGRFSVFAQSACPRTDCGSPAGAIFRVPGEELASEPDAGYSLHDFRWQHALTAARKIFAADFPSDVTVYLIEAASLAFGLPLSAPVLASANRVVEEVQEIIGAFGRLEVPAMDGAARVTT
jgi:Ni,Fe-hydrogenase maturation factor